MFRIHRLFLVLAVGLTIPVPAHAHVKWFIDAPTITRDPTLSYHIGDPAVMIWMSVVLMMLILAYVVDHVAPTPPEFLKEKGRAWRNRILYTFQLIIGVTLLITAYRGAVLAPHLAGEAGIALSLKGMEALVGVLFICNLWVKPGAVLLFLIFFASAGIFGPLMSLEYFNFLGIAIFLIFLKSSPESWLGRRRVWATPLLRVHTGVALSVLAFSEKLLRPELAMAFIAKHDINFMRAVGIERFSDHLFVLSAGFSELLFGLIFLTGLVTRVNTIALTFFLIASNLYFFFMGEWAEGILEIIGHGNLFAIAMIFVFCGAGSRLRLRPGRVAWTAEEVLTEEEDIQEWRSWDGA